MTPYKNSPLAEMSLAIQYSDRRHLPAAAAIDLFSSIRSAYPNIDLMPRIEALGAAHSSIQAFEDTLQPRWGLATENLEYLLQFQDDLVAYNWRRISDRPAGAPYPGFEEMQRRLGEWTRMWGDFTGGEVAPKITACALYYDNIWPIGDTDSVADVYAFWNTVGITGQMNGPEVRWTVVCQSDFLGPNARVEVVASVGTIGGAEPQKAARLIFNSIAHPREDVSVDDVFAELHLRVHDYLERLTTPETRGAWNV